MVNYRKEWNYDTISVVGSLKGITDVSVIADTIRKDLGLNVEWYKECGNPSEAFNKDQCGFYYLRWDRAASSDFEGVGKEKDSGGNIDHELSEFQ